MSAKVDPLVVIKRQIHKPNMLVVFDTSGSLTGVPGGGFSNGAEVGVDCDDGMNCRGGGAGRCKESGLTCSTDSDCATSRCESDGKDCTKDLDCAATGKCSLDNAACRTSSDCSSNVGKCSVTNGTCTVSPNNCPARGKCSKGDNRICTNPGGTCDFGTCAASSSTYCTSNNDCPYATSGTCSIGGKSCTSDSNCPDMKTCNVGGKTCTSDSNCPDTAGKCTLDGKSCTSNSQCPPKPGKCAKGNKSCTSNSDCPAQDGKCAEKNINCKKNSDCGEHGPCDIPANACEGIKSNSCSGFVDNYCRTNDNYCKKPRTTCNKFTNNVCNPIANACNKQSNSCNAGVSNLCRSSITDICSTGQQGLLGTYYDDIDFTGKTVLRLDGTVNFGWSGSPVSGIGSDTFSVRWLGRLIPPTTGTYTFYTNSDDGVRLTLDDKVIIENWQNHGDTENTSANINLVAGQPYAIKLEHYDNSGSAVIRLRWKGPGISKQIIPKTAFTSGAPAFMCRIGQTICQDDLDCTAYPDDTCGPPTSRAVIAKRAVAKLIAANYNVVNLGLMTFYQSGYFPYYQLSSASTKTERFFVSRERLEVEGCWDKTSGPRTSCTLGGTVYNLDAVNNSRYGIDMGTSSVRIDDDWCGTACSLAAGTGRYEGSYYTRSERFGTMASSPKSPVSATYVGKSYVSGSTSFRYFEPRNDYYNEGVSPPFKVASCGSGCGSSCGGRWDPSLSDFIDPKADKAAQQKNAAKMLAWTEPAALGGLMTFGGTPSGCTLKNDGAPSRSTSAYHYMKELKEADSLTCRPNYVLFITDGEANGPGDVDCDSAACGADDLNPAKCQCRAVWAAHELKKLGVKTFVVGFSSDAAGGKGAQINDNIAKAGGTDQGNDGQAPFAFAATNEEQLTRVLQETIYEAVKGSYSTTPAAASAGIQQPDSILSGDYALDARVDFPSWNGHLIAFDIKATPPQKLWDAAEVLAAAKWWERRVYIGTKGGQVIPITVDPSTLRVSNAATLVDAGFGATPEDADRLARFALGDPAMKNPIKLGAIINSTPIEIGPPGNMRNMPGGRKFYEQYKNRIGLTYVGADDGMLHAFFTKETTVGGKDYPPGTEAFAFIPPDMFAVIGRLYAQGGQLADPDQHVFGLASSPKAKNLCVGGCDHEDTALWRTLLVVPQGPGGNNTFVLDVTEPVTPTGFSSPPVKLQWHTQFPALASYENLLGDTFSVPAFVYEKSDDKSKYRIAMASGYPVEGGATTQGKSFVVADASTGSIVDSRPFTEFTSCGRPYAVLADVATAKDHGTGQESKWVAAYVGDTAGTLWRYSASGLAPVAKLGCGAPLHFSPTVIQLDRDDAKNAAHDVYLVQATNSALDDETNTVGFAPSQLLIMKEKFVSDGVFEAQTSFGDNGQILLRVGVNNEICGVTDSRGACLQAMPLSARPTGTPSAILKRDGSGFLLITMWYAPDLQGCSKGETYLTLHEVLGQTVTQKQGVLIEKEPVTSPVIVGGKIFVVTSTGVKEIGANINATFSSGTVTVGSGPGARRFRMTGWKEVF